MRIAALLLAFLFVLSRARAEGPAHLLWNGTVVCTSSRAFDTYWHAVMTRPQAGPLAIPTCLFLYGQWAPAHASVLRRIRDNKTEVRIDDGPLAGLTGFTDAFLP